MFGIGCAGLLIFIAVFLISNTIRITIISRSREIQIMRLVGAKNGYIRGPFLLEGAFYWLAWCSNSFSPCILCLQYGLSIGQ